MNLHQHAKKYAISSFYSKDILNLKFRQSDCSTAFWLMHQELDFSQMDMHKKVVSNVDIYTCQYFHSLFK